MSDMSLTEEINNAIHFSLYALDTPERRERLISDVKRVIGDRHFKNVIEVSEEGRPVLSAFYQSLDEWESELQVVITKPTPDEETEDTMPMS